MTQQDIDNVYGAAAAAGDLEMVELCKIAQDALGTPECTLTREERSAFEAVEAALSV